MNCRLLIFAKTPVQGKVKTRLARGVGEERALKIYIHLLEHTIQVAQLSGLKTEIWLAEENTEHPFFDRFNLDLKRQQGTDLGQRMYHAFEKSFAEQADSPVIIIGSDCPGLNEEVLTEACEQLKKHDAVFGPASDGGYYLIGLKKANRDLLVGKAWSHGNVLKEALKELEKLNLDHHLLPELSDVDREEDWLRLKDRLGR